MTLKDIAPDRMLTIDEAGKALGLNLPRFANGSRSVESVITG
jgi:hypothetical protein